jgi:hypothetical protein
MIAVSPEGHLELDKVLPSFRKVYFKDLNL